MIRLLKNPLMACAILTAESQAQQLTHRWSFGETGAAPNGRSLADSISNAPAVIRGVGATLDGTTLTLPGTSDGNQPPATISAYLDLPNGIISSKTNLTLEIWATPRSMQSWQRLFDFGQMNTAGSGEVVGTETAAVNGTQARDSLMLSISREGNLANQRFSGRIDGGTEYMTDASAATTINTRYHFAATYQAGVGTYPAGGKITWYRNGTAIGNVDLPFRLADLQDVNNWLGRSQWSGDRNAHVSYDEVRLHDYALSPAQIAASSANGPDTFPAPLAAADSITMHRGQKARIQVLANDSNAQTLSIAQAPQSGTAVVTADRRILYTHTTGAPTSDSFTYTITNPTGQASTATVTLQFAETLRVANPNLNVPSVPPPTTLSLINALPGLSFAAPVCLRTPPGENRRLFVCEKGGLLKVVSDTTAPAPTATTFLDLPALLTSRGESIATSSECGLLGIAFHPDYASNRQFYLFYSVNAGGLRQRVSRFTTQAGNPDAADPASELILINQADEADNHNGGDLHFGAEGYLYISVGDEGGSNDNYNNSQTITKDLFAGILRIDVDRRAGNVEPTPHAAIPLDGGVARFSIPKDNPFVLPANGGTWDGRYNGTLISNANAVRREFFATGLRNPWRFSIDGTDIWCGDVGQGAREEVDLIQKGGNYGWAYREGTLNGPKAAAAPTNFDTLYHSPPIYDYNRTAANFGGYSITGGLVYRGTRIGSLTGKYLFGDYGSGSIWSLQRNGANPPTVERIAAEGGVSAFGSDPANQDLLIADIDGNRILRLVASTPIGNFPSTLSATGLFADLTDLAPAPGVLPYSVNLPFWSDHAEKKRWFIVPDGVSTFGWQQETPWSLPAGTIWVKHFDMTLNRNPITAEAPIRKRVETRLIVRNGGGVYGVSYRWNADGTEATLADDAGEDFVLNVTDGGVPTPQNWRIPSRSECLTCHTPQGGYALSFNTRQINLTQDILGFPGNQLDILRQNLFFSGAGPGSPNLLPRHLRPDEEAFSQEARVRSYLAVNCGYCHQSGGTAPSNWDGRAELNLEQTGLILGTPVNSGSDPANRLVVPGDAPHSALLSRITASNGFTRMPPLGSNQIDQTNAALVSQWITGELAARKTFASWRELEFGSTTSPEGEPLADPDGDGASNQAEYLAGTSPTRGTSTLRPTVALAGDGVKLGFNLPNNRSYRIHRSSDLSQWTPWDIPGNQGLPTAGGLIEITGPRTGTSGFYRVEIREN